MPRHPVSAEEFPSALALGRFLRAAPPPTSSPASRQKLKGLREPSKTSCVAGGRNVTKEAEKSGSRLWQTASAVFRAIRIRQLTRTTVVPADPSRTRLALFLPSHTQQFDAQSPSMISVIIAFTERTEASRAASSRSEISVSLSLGSTNVYYTVQPLEIVVRG